MGGGREAARAWGAMGGSREARQGASTHMRQLSPGLHSMMFLPTPRESMVSRWRAATSPSGSLGVGVEPEGQETVGHAGAGGHSRAAGHCGQLGKSGQRGHVGQRATALSTADCTIDSVGGAAHAGQAGQRAAAAAATFWRSAHGEIRG